MFKGFLSKARPAPDRLSRGVGAEIVLEIRFGFTFSGVDA